jgi:hypothetical protein
VAGAGRDPVAGNAAEDWIKEVRRLSVQEVKVSDEPENRIIAAIASLRADLMARMDRLQSRMDSLDEHLTLGPSTPCH